ncbi:MAG: hypothetical protein K0U20_08405 [Proteobacteria bacterium]|nr:hypothetical protein [Pseudomonadota bacterium]
MITQKSQEQERREAMKDINRASLAEQLINNPLYREAIDAMQLAMQQQFADTKLSDDNLRHELWQRMQLMKQFQGKFEHIVKKGAKAKQTLTMLERAKEKFRM